MTPKTIHLCWFSNDAYPVEIKVCLDSWKRILPDYTVRLWDYDAAKSVGCAYIDEALSARKWAFAADALRFYAIYHEGGIYMDSDIFLYKRFDELIPETGVATLTSAPETATPPSDCRRLLSWAKKATVSAKTLSTIMPAGILSSLTALMTKRYRHT